MNNYDSVSKFYKENAKNFSKTRVFPWPSTREFLDNLPENFKVLDIGCGNGRNLFFRNDLDMVGIELSKELYERAKINCPKARIINSDINELDNIKDEKFDLIICTAVLEHLEYPEKTVSNIYSLLSENGITVWTVPDPFWEKIATSVGHLDDDQHHHIPNIRELKELAKSNNLKVIEAKKFMFSFILNSKV